MNNTKYESIIVGAAQGIGETLARRLARRGTLLIVDVNSEANDALAASLRDEGHHVDARTLDITDTAAVAELVQEAGAPRYLALVAGIFAASPSLEASPSQFERIFAVNTIGIYDIARQFAAVMATNGGGAICAIGSIAARMPRMRQAAYSASKAGMRQALRVLAMEVIADGVRINFVAPGPTVTPMVRALAADHAGVDLAAGEPEAFRPRIPDARLAETDDIAAAMEFLLSDQSVHIVMHDLFVDGGESLGI